VLDKIKHTHTHTHTHKNKKKQQQNKQKNSTLSCCVVTWKYAWCPIRHPNSSRFCSYS